MIRRPNVVLNLLTTCMLAALWLTGAAAREAHAAAAASKPLLNRFIHLRSAEQREWLEFPKQPDSTTWSREFDLTAEFLQADAATLRFQQDDVKQPWTVTLNGAKLGELVRDENRMWTHFEIPTGLLRATGNRISVEASRPDPDKSDDIQIGFMSLEPFDRSQWLCQSTLEIEVREGQKLTPCRVTLIDESGALVETGATSSHKIAVRTGVVYTLDKPLTIPVPPGHYTVFAGRGFEYSVDQKKVTVSAGETAEARLHLQRQVDTAGWVACDTHVHTLTHSGHGDSSVYERMVTLAGEGIELPIATDHNINVDHRPFAAAVGADRFFTPVIGNEVTTRWGHFNVFPFQPGTPPPNHRDDNWPAIFAEIESAPNVKVVILNHARDIHSNYRPFGPAAHHAAVGENLQGWPLRANAMEVLNSSATQSDVMQLFRDWMTLLNRGLPITPVGSSDSHDVARHFVGQGRTYVRCEDREPGMIDVEMATVNFAAGRVRVSYGLWVELYVAERWSCGELAAVSGRDTVPVTIRIRGPHWVQADHIALYLNGSPIRELDLEPTERPADGAGGIIWSGVWRLPRLSHDGVLTAIATGPGTEQPYWQCAKPYQPTSPDWTSRFIGCSGAIRLDVDGDGKFSSARDYAAHALSTAGGELGQELMQTLGDYDAATTAQALWLLEGQGARPLRDSVRALFQQAKPQVRRGYDEYVKAWRDNQQAAGR